MEDLSDFKKEYEQKGYFIIKSYLDKELINEINNFLNSAKPVMYIPYSKNVPWGYGNLINNKSFMNFFPLELIKNSISKYINPKYMEINHILAVNKAPFIGPDVEWHQEFFNVNTFAPGYDPLVDINKFMQIFIGIDQHTNENGPLLFFEGSHKEGLLESEDIINNNLVHKRRLIFSELERISKKYELRKMILEKGDAVFFNHLLVHGSATNCSKQNRRALILQVRSSEKSKDEGLYLKEVNHRKSFLIDKCYSKIKQLNNDNSYSEQSSFIKRK